MARPNTGLLLKAANLAETRAVRQAARVSVIRPFDPYAWFLVGVIGDRHVATASFCPRSDGLFAYGLAATEKGLGFAKLALAAAQDKTGWPLVLHARPENVALYERLDFQVYGMEPSLIDRTPVDVLIREAREPARIALSESLETPSLSLQRTVGTIGR